jgi:hypothetical protein
MSRTVSIPWTGVNPPCEIDAADLDEIVQFAGSVLFGLSGGRVGLFTTVQDQYWTAPVRSTCFYQTPWGDLSQFDTLQNVRSNDCCAIELQNQPVQSITEVRVDGDVLDPTGYVLLGNSLHRVGACWPRRSGDKPRIQVDYQWGVRPGIVAKMAAAELACEVSAAMSPGQTCSLPSAWTDIVRQGVTVKRPNITELVKAGFTGLPLTDQFIRTYNPNGLRQRARVVSVDSVRRAIT